MNQILKSFIDNLFIGIESDMRITKIKEELYVSTQEKYEDLLSDGFTENEAVGKVIAEFGDLNEILNELDIHIDINENDVLLTKTEYLKKYRSHKLSALLIGIATFLILTVVGVVATISELTHFDLQDLTQSLVLILGIMPSIGLYIYAGIKIESEKNKDHASYNLDNETKKYLKNENEKDKKRFPIAIISGVCLSLLGVVFFILGSDGIMSDFFKEGSFLYLIGFMIIGIAVFIFIYFGMINEFLSKGLENKSSKKKSDSLAEKLSGAIFILATIVYLISGFAFNAWGYMWFVFPIAGLISGIFHIFWGNKEDK